jgi:hypothetical protein
LHKIHRMDLKSSILFSISMLYLLLFIQPNRAQLIDQKQDSSKTATSESVMKFYLEKLLSSKLLRDNLKEDLNQLTRFHSVIENKKEKRQLFPILKSLKRNFNELELVLNDIVLDDNEIEELIETYKGLTDENNTFLTNNDEMSMDMKKFNHLFKRSQQFKLNFYQKVPVIRTG